MSSDIEDTGVASRLSQPVHIDYAAREREDDKQYPNRPKNHGQTLPFRTLYQDLFNPLIANKNQPSAKVHARQLGPKAVNRQSPHEKRRQIIQTYVSRWRKEVGNDFYPAMRLILPDKDRHRAMYGLKEKVLAKYFVKILRIDRHSDDAYSMLNWKQPVQNATTKAGDFPSRVYEVLSKRPFRVEPTDLTVEEVNDLLDTLSVNPKEEFQLPIIEDFYRQMNPEDLKWLISIILRTMNVGATEKTFLSIWHDDGEKLFNISSSLKRVCWELYDSSVALRTDRNRSIELFACFQPQLAQFQPKKMTSVATRMHVTEEDPDFWIEEKLDGERMQLHMRTRTTKKEKDKEGSEKEVPCPPWKEFSFWSRKAKDYTYLYGSSFDDDKSALTRHLKHAFHEGVESTILDGEMITWDPETDKMVPFGTLKTAALEQQRNPFAPGPRPLYRVFDILYLNGDDLTAYTLRDRRNALEKIINPVERRLEVLQYHVGHDWNDIELALRKVVAEASEGLVVKNPRSRYRLNDRNDDWVKVKPEYMEEFGESIDCLVIGGYYGSGKRGGGLSSFLCGLRHDDEKEKGKSKKFLSFFKVGGGMTANDYANIKHHTENKWIKWDRDNPPTDYIELGGGVQYQRERPDVWIKPEDSLVIQAKAASVSVSDEFAANLTLRFPRFQKLRTDKDWQTSLSLQEFYEVRDSAEQAKEENQQNKAMNAESRKRHQRVDLRKKPMQVLGYSQKAIRDASTQDGGRATGVFRGLTLCIMTDATQPEKKTKIELEELVKAHGGHITQTAQLKGPEPTQVICIASKRLVKVTSLLKRGDIPILKPIWLFDCIAQAQKDTALDLNAVLLKPEMTRHVFFSPEDQEDMYTDEVDRYDDSFARDTTVEELRQCMEKMDNVDGPGMPDERLIESVSEAPGMIFTGTVVYLTPSEHGDFDMIKNILSFGGAGFAEDLDAAKLTHVVVDEKNFGAADVRKLRRDVAGGKRPPRIVSISWVEESWKEKTRLDEERFVPL